MFVMIRLKVTKEDRSNLHWYALTHINVENATKFGHISWSSIITGKHIMNILEFEQALLIMWLYLTCFDDITWNMHDKNWLGMKKGYDQHELAW